MTAINITDLNNAKLDVDHIAAVATGTAATATDRLGGVKKTMRGASDDVTAKVALVEAAKNTAINTDIPAKVALVDAAVAATYVGQAQASASAASTSSTIATTAAATSGAYPSAAASNVPQGLTQASVGSITAGAGGTNGTFALGWSGGNFLVNPTGTFTVAGGALTAVTITGPGLYIGGAVSVPTPSFAASAGLGGGAAVTLTAQFLITSGQGYWVQSTDGQTLNRYKNVSGVATADTSIGSLLTAKSYGNSVSVPTSRTLDALRDTNGAFISGTRADGSRVRWNNPNARRIRSRLVGAYWHVFISDKLGETQLTFGSSNNTAPEVMLDKIAFTSDRRGAPEPYYMNMDGTGATPAASLVYEHWQFNGQSLSTGDQGGAALTTVNAESRAQMLSLSVVGAYGPRTFCDSNPISGDSVIDQSKVTGLTPLVEAFKGLAGASGETPASGFASQYLKTAPTTARMVVDVHGRGAAGYIISGGVGLQPGSPHFANGVIFQEMMRKYVEAASGNYRYAGTVNIHGETDSGVPTTRATYLGYIQEWAGAYNSQARHASAIHRKQPFLVSQLGTNLRFAGNTTEQGLAIAFAQMDAHKLKAGIYLAGPRYMLPTADGTHSTSAGYRWLGEMLGKVARKIKKEGVDWEPLRIKSYTRNGTVVNVQFYVPVAPLQFKTTYVSDPGNAGFSYIDDTASGITVTGVALGSDGVSVNVTLSGTGFGTNPRIRIAGTQATTTGGPTSGARSTLCDSDTELGVLSGLPLHNYACHDEVAIA